MTIPRLRSADFAPYRDKKIVRDGQKYSAQNGGYPHALNVSSDGKLKFRVEPGDAWRKDYPNNPAMRSEVSQNGVLTYDESWWMRLTVAVSFDDDIIAASQNIISQVHALDSLGHRGPILSFNVSPGPTLTIRTAEDRVSPLPPWKYVDRYVLDNFRLDTPYQFTTRAVFNADGAGQLDVWMKEGPGPTEKVLVLRNIKFGYHGDTGPYQKGGAYVKPPEAKQSIDVYYLEWIGPTRDNLMA